MVSGPPNVYALEIPKRPRQTWTQTFYAILFVLVFDIGCLMINGFQFVVLVPLKLLPLPGAHKLYDEAARYSKGAFGTLIGTQIFAPTTLVVSFEREGLGRFSEKEIKEIVERDEAGKVVALRLPQKAVMIANHQVYADWWYAWCLTYLMGTYKDVFIVLKKSLKWVPVVGWGMQFYNFIFLARSWASDRLHLSASLSWLGQRAEKQDTPLTFILYPEGTLVSKDTRPLSKKYADKMGIPDMQHTLLPRSTGLHYSLRSLAPRIPSLQLIDITVSYPGIPAFGYGQSYYTLRSIFLDGVPPPKVHMHLRRFDVAMDVPIGNLSKSKPPTIPNGGSLKPPSKKEVVEIEIPQDERDTFDLWLRNLWKIKDTEMSQFLNTGSFVGDSSLRVEIPVAIRRKREMLDAFAFFVPALVGWILSRMT
ncbi:hypothetical protein PHLCEN_2v5302 [Hermanssonia centrifuga]|uniref:Phospholipid/glycerol acyltransferase domain-containing protein n=1 Tax=Hermanssonia centrifuga TaxID=98765 RepID=A0A2R6P5Z9_9APHY|nr:hypothetical protein PHLCEN_2v5302 [Hermanssonia centrifuga]